MVAYIPDPEAFVQNFLQILDIVFLIGQNKNTLTLDTQCVFFYTPSSIKGALIKKKEVMHAR